MNLRRFLSQIALATGVLLFSAGLQTLAAFTAPSTAPPGADAYAPLHTGPDAQSKVGGLLLNTGGAINGLIVQNGNVGIGTASPTAKLDIAGDIKIGNSNTACTTANVGSLRYNATGKKMEFCSPDGAGAGVSGWAAMGNVAASAHAPDTQTFNTSGTWTKPSGFSSTATALVRCWGSGGGGGGGSGGTPFGGGSGGANGGGGAYDEASVLLSALPSTASVSIIAGAGGAGGGGSYNANPGGTGGTGGSASPTSFGSVLSAAGGGGGGGGGGIYGGGSGPAGSGGIAYTPNGVSGSSSGSAGNGGGLGSSPGGGGSGGGGGSSEYTESGGPAGTGGSGGTGASGANGRCIVTVTDG